MADWDSPERSRMFLVAALLTGTFGFFATSEVGKWDAPQLAQPVPMSLARDQERAAAAAYAEGSGRQLAPNEAASADEGLRDALASAPGSQAAQMATRTAAFSGPAGRVPGAFAPASAQGAGAARQIAPGLDASSSNSAAGGAAPSGRQSGKPWARPAEPETREGGAPAVSASKGRHAKEPTPSERLFDTESARAAASASSARAASRSAAESAAARQARERAERERGERRRKITLASLLGKGALKAPQKLSVPSFKPWNDPLPEKKATALGEAKAERVATPPTCSKGGKHWDENAEGRWHHDGPKRGRLTQDGWTWLRRHDGRWWQWPSPKSGALVRHQDHWWLQNRGAWFLLHDGQPWGYRQLAEWGLDGFVHSSGAQLIYSADGSRLAVVIPGDGAVIYDAYSGIQLHRWTEDEMPRRPAPRSLPKN